MPAWYASEVLADSESLTAGEAVSSIVSTGGSSATVDGGPNGTPKSPQ
jgi:nicotinamide mononucleotide (NMN) deamidase PncC